METDGLELKMQGTSFNTPTPPGKPEKKYRDDSSSSESDDSGTEGKGRS